MIHPMQSPVRQQGAVLIVTLILLIMLTLLGVTGMENTTLEERMAGNLRDQSLALHAAEAAVRAGEFWVDKQYPEPTATKSCTSGCASAVFELDVLDYTSDAIWSSPAVRTYSDKFASVTSQPKYYIEYHSFVPDSLALGKQGDDSGRTYFQIIGRGTGSSDNSRALIESTYTRRF